MASWLFDYEPSMHCWHTNRAWSMHDRLSVESMCADGAWPGLFIVKRPTSLHPPPPPIMSLTL